MEKSETPDDSRFCPPAAENEFEKVAKRLTGIADEVEFIATDEYESDGGEGDLEKLIGLLLRESGDMLNQKVGNAPGGVSEGKKATKVIHAFVCLQMEEEKVNPTVLFSYSFFENLLTTFLERIGYRNSRSDDLRPQASTETQVAVACEVRRDLSFPFVENRYLDEPMPFFFPPDH